VIIQGGDMGEIRDEIVPRRILDRIPLKRVHEDLERYQAKAIEMGAEAAKIISSKQIIIDERVRSKCIYPKCVYYGTNTNCPPYVPDLDFTRKVIGNYHYAILFSVKSKTEDFIGTDYLKKSRGIKNPGRLLLNHICSEIESRSYYEGYYLSMAFGQGPCKSFWCPDQPCAALQPGTSCRFPLKSRGSMEALGMDVFKMASRQGWEIYPCGERAKREDLPHVLLVGLALIY
jgi:predicted metal-binding protein